MSFPVECTDLEATESRLVRLSPTKEQKRIFKNWTDISRFVFNWTIDYLRSCMNFSPTWMGIKKNMYGSVGLPEWTKIVPFQIKGIAIKDACNAFWKANGRPKFRSRKNPEQSCFIPKSAIKQNGIYPRLSGKGLKCNELIPDKPMDSRLIWRAGKWWISIPNKRIISRSENQASEIVAIDPGIRTFAAFYSPNLSGKIGEGDFSQIYRLLIHLDHLYSERSKANNRRRKSLTKAIRRLSAKIKNLVDELHWKTSRFLCENFSVILLPTFETKEMVRKLKRKIRAKTVRSMLGFGFYRFKQRIKWMAKKLGKTVVDVSEAYTSKTHPQTGEVKNIGSTKWIRLLDGSMADRDLVGAHNILVKFLTENYALGDTPTGLRV
ncbi:MAG: IS200/IS605 family element transposase accessory protein TnpB [Desulfobacteraceae bacterium]|nr:IS200/IS605 family element transposase accessory protein TnpB [Desulfobacteraceae bacterium]